MSAYLFDCGEIILAQPFLFDDLTQLLVPVLVRLEPILVLPLLLVFELLGKLLESLQ